MESIVVDNQALSLEKLNNGMTLASRASFNLAVPVHGSNFLSKLFCWIEVRENCNLLKAIFKL